MYVCMYERIPLNVLISRKLHILENSEYFKNNSFYGVLKVTNFGYHLPKGLKAISIFSFPKKSKKSWFFEIFSISMKMAETLYLSRFYVLRPLHL